MNKTFDCVTFQRRARQLLYEAYRTNPTEYLEGLAVPESHGRPRGRAAARPRVAPIPGQ